MKRAFTLIELMIVIAVMAVLMGIVYRLTSAGTDTHKRTVTIMRMQKLENCLSGYYAAFGSYPPVKLHGTRDIYATVDAHGIQQDERDTGVLNGDEGLVWEQIEAACKAQPIDCRFPFSDDFKERVEEVSKVLKERAESGDFDDISDRRRSMLIARFDSASDNIGRFDKDLKDWRSIQLFKFGLLSFLLPRYLVMMNGPEDYYLHFAQWTANNVMPSNPFTGQSFENYGGWGEIRRRTYKDNPNRETDFYEVANIPSQAVCARWMPNLKGICRVYAGEIDDLFGIDIKDSEATVLDEDNPYIEIFSPDEGFSRQYVLDGVTIADGWGNVLYYYSPPPFQRYTLWSAGANRRTFPPWIDRKTLNSKANELVGKWIHDDIIHLSN